MTNRMPTKRGATAIYIVIFMTIILSVITVSFMRVMTANIGNTVNSDLSVSAYDSALAGIEDAKAVLVRYRQCLDAGKKADNSASPDPDTCEGFLTIVANGIKEDSCDTVANALKRPQDTDDSSVIIQETTNIDESSVELLQAYTCVKITENLADYRGTLDADNRTILVPLRTYTEDYGKIRALKIMWHSQALAEKTNTQKALGTVLPSRDGELIPALTLDIYQTATNFTVGQLSTRKNDQLDFVELFLRPSEIVGTRTPKIVSTSEVIGLADKQNNSPVDVKCSKTAFYCTAIINLPAPIGGGSYGGFDGVDRNYSTFFLKLGLPYANTSGTDFSVTMCKKDNCQNADGLETPLDDSVVAFFVGVQANVDSTGRANDIYRRVDVRIDLIGTSFPYPEYAIWMAGTGDTDVDKDFWVTQNCRRKNSSANDLMPCSDSDYSN